MISGIFLISPGNRVSTFNISMESGYPEYNTRNIYYSVLDSELYSFSCKILAQCNENREKTQAVLSSTLGPYFLSKSKVQRPVFLAGSLYYIPLSCCPQTQVEQFKKKSNRFFFLGGGEGDPAFWVSYLPCSCVYFPRLKFLELSCLGLSCLMCLYLPCLQRHPRLGLNHA